jgi:preprotein translocase subunit SecG
MVNDNDKKMNVYDLTECTEERDQIKKQNRETIPYVVNFTREFNEKYGETLNEFLGTGNKNFTMLDINDFCDAFLSSYTDQRELTEFKKTGLDLEETNDYCYEYFRVSYLYQIHGDEDKILAHVDSSKLMTELIYFMKRRLDADITKEDEDANVKDYSRPKMLMISGHDSTSSADEIFLFKALGLNYTEKYIFPRYAAQLALEVRTKDDSKEKTSYADYYVEGYFNDKELFNVPADEFITKVEGEIWSQEKIDEFCGFGDSQITPINPSGNNGNSSSSSGSTDSEKKDNAKTAYKVLMSIFICLSAILLATTLVLCYKLSKSKPPIDHNYNHNISTNKINI